MFFKFIAYLKHLLKAKSAFGIHAPYAFDFYTKAVKTKHAHSAAIIEIEQLRKFLKRSKETISVTDFGTGALKKNPERKVSDIAGKYANSVKDALLIYRMVSYLKPDCILELGTSFGFTTMYMAKAAPLAQIYSIEGCPETAGLAMKNFEALQLKINLHVGNIDEILPELLNKVINPDFIFFDGNHTKEATLRYFEWCLKYVSEKTVFVFDDIYWSIGMKEAWLQIVSHPEIGLSMDLFSLGIVFFKKNSAKQHFVLKY